MANQHTMPEIHIGNMIFEELRKQRRSVTWFAKEMGCTRCNMYKILGKPHLNSEFILRAMRLLNHDFFHDISTQFREGCVENWNILCRKLKQEKS